MRECNGVREGVCWRMIVRVCEEMRGVHLHTHEPTHRKLYAVQYTVYNVQCTMYSVQYTVYNVQCTMYIVHCTPCNVRVFYCIRLCAVCVGVRWCRVVRRCAYVYVLMCIDVCTVDLICESVRW